MMESVAGYEIRFIPSPGTGDLAAEETAKSYSRHTPPPVCCVASPRLATVFMQSRSPLNAARRSEGGPVRWTRPGPRLGDPDRRTAVRRRLVPPASVQTQHRQTAPSPRQSVNPRLAGWPTATEIESYQNTDFAQWSCRWFFALLELLTFLIAVLLVVSIVERDRERESTALLPTTFPKSWQRLAAGRTVAATV